MLHAANKVLFPILISLLAILAPIYATMAAVGFLVFMDFITGTYAAYKRKEKITSAGFRRTVSKSVIYLIAVICGFLVETYLTGSIVPVTKTVAGFIGLTELKSVLENLNSIFGMDIFKSLLVKLGSQNDPTEPKDPNC